MYQSEPPPRRPFPPPQAVVFETIVAGPLAWTTPQQLVAAGVEPALLEQLQAARLLDKWDHPRGPYLTLAPYTAWRMGVHLGQVAGVLRWVSPTGSIKPSARRPADWAPWNWAPKPPKPAFLCDEVWGLELVLFGRKIKIDRRIPPPQPGRAIALSGRIAETGRGRRKQTSLPHVAYDGES